MVFQSERDTKNPFFQIFELNSSDGKAVVALAIALLSSLGLVIPVSADSETSIEPLLREHVEYLADESLEGRLTGTKGARRAARYVVKRLEALEAQPLPGTSSLIQPFEFVAGTKDTGSSFTLPASNGNKRSRWSGTEDVRGLSFSESGVVSGPVVFAGYGLSLPDGADIQYDSYVGLDVKDKIVLILRYEPEDVDDESRAAMSRYSGLRYKAMAARDLGAKAVLVVAGPRSPRAGETVSMSFDAALSDSGIVAGSISGAVAAKLFERTGKSIEEVQRALDDGNPHVAGFDIPGPDVELEVRVARKRREGRNVIAYFPANADGGDPERHVVFGAHYDHLGRGNQGTSLARKGETDQVHPGADDNASGVAALLELADVLAERPRKKSWILAFWSGEEIGLLGSSHFVKSGPIPVDAIEAYVNFDMVGRVKDNRLNLQGAGSSSAWSKLIERANVPVGFDVRVQQDPYLPMDSTAFYQAKVPTLSFFTGSHEDYHRPTDTPEFINYEGLAGVVTLASLIGKGLDGLDERPDYLEVTRTHESRVDTDSRRAYTGTIPDYTTEVEGLLLGGVAADGPADRAGLKGGDIIVEFAGRPITNIYDYTYALDAVKVDDEVGVAYVRDGIRGETTIVPTHRP